ncbi:MAG: hypothetical protein JWO69_2041 [Thermoleophilia bacterium]|nr:hypothetical protein [Thermoleophilia bacterium]
MTWKRNFCSATNRDGTSCSNPAPDGRRGLCRTHEARLQRDAADRNRGESFRWYCRTCGKTHNHTAEQRDAHRDEIRAAEAAAMETRRGQR